MWMMFPESKPAKFGIYTTRLEKNGEVEFLHCFFYPEEGRFGSGLESIVTAWCEIADFQKAKHIMKRPSDHELVESYLDNKGKGELSELFAELFTTEEMRRILLTEMSLSTFKGIAEDEWSDICYDEDCRREVEAWRMGRW